MVSELFPPEQEDFPLFDTKERTLTYRNRFSLRLTEEEMNAYRIQVIVSPVYASQRGSENLEYAPPRGNWARFTAWSQDVGVVRSGLLQFPTNVIFDWRNEGMLTRWWQAALFWISANLEAGRVTALASGLLVLPGFQILYDGAVLAQTVAFNEYLQSTGIPSETPEGSVPALRIPAFAPPETLWKFVADFEEIWFQATVKIWYIAANPNLPIELPTPEGEEPESNSDGQGNNVPSGGEPPADEDESPLDPRNDAGDYDTAQPEEPEQPPDGVEVSITITQGAVWTDNETGQSFAEPDNVTPYPCGSGVVAPVRVVEEVSGGFRRVFAKFTPPGGSEFGYLISGSYSASRYTLVSLPQIRYDRCN